MNLNNQIEWFKYVKSKKLPNTIPISVQHVYRKEWKGWGDFLGTGTIASKLKKFRPYKGAKKYAQSLKLKGWNEWLQHTKSKNFPKDIPVSLFGVYKKEFESISAFLGTGRKPRSKKS